MIDKLLNDPYFNRENFPDIPWTQEWIHPTSKNGNVLSQPYLAPAINHFVRNNLGATFIYRTPNGEDLLIDSKESLLKFIENNPALFETLFINHLYNAEALKGRIRYYVKLADKMKLVFDPNDPYLSDRDVSKLINRPYKI